MVRHLKQPTDLHTKGILTLGLVLVAESVSLSNAVTFWSAYQSWSHDHQARGRGVPYEDSPFAQAAQRAVSQQKKCETADAVTPGEESCLARPSLPPARLYPRNRLARRVSTERRFSDDCCLECSNCMDPEQVMKQCYVPRGGHVPVREAAETVASAVGSSHTPTPYGIPLNGWKVIFQAFLTAINVFCWLVPLRSKKMTENKLALSLANAFSGGVFLSLAFGHLIPECVHGFHGYNEVMPYMIVLGGYLLIFFVEKVAFDAHGALHEMEHNQDGRQQEAPVVVNGGTMKQGNGESKSSSRGAVILLGALAVHSVLEMTALGLSDSFGDAALLTLSIALHQPAESIALLVAFLKSGMPKNEIIQFLSIFSAMGPIGVALGMAVNEFAAPIVDSVMLATVAGTFVYVGATEVIPEEWEEPEHKWKKFAALMCGIVSIFFITQYTMSLEGMG